jgi:hypothetical protein
MVADHGLYRTPPFLHSPRLILQVFDATSGLKSTVVCMLHGVLCVCATLASHWAMRAVAEVSRFGIYVTLG